MKKRTFFWILIFNFSFLAGCAKTSDSTTIQNQEPGHSTPIYDDHPNHQDDQNPKQNESTPKLDKPISEKNNPFLNFLAPNLPKKPRPINEEKLKRGKDNLFIRNDPHSSNLIDLNPHKTQHSYEPNQLNKTIHAAENFPTNLQTEFQDVVDRTVQDQHILINGQKIDLTTKRIQYNILNRTFAPFQDYVSFNNWDPVNENNGRYDTPTSTSRSNFIPNDTYRKILKYSSAIQFSNTYLDPKIGKTNFSDDLSDLIAGERGGTAWILDYQLPNKSQSYPLVWYYATNLHVARALSSLKSYPPYQADPQTNIITNKLYMRYFPSGSQTALGEENSGPYNGTANNSGLAFIDDVRLIYTDRDFLKSQPADFFPGWFKTDEDEFIDFAVMEIHFKDAKQAQDVTQNYFYEKEKFQFLDQSYLNRQNKWKGPEFYSAGFPEQSNGRVMKTNKNGYENGLENKNLSSQIINQGSPFSNAFFHSSFTNYEGIYDSLLNLTNYKIKYWGKPIVLSGLAYLIRHDAMGIGSSGSMVVNQNNQIMSIHFADWNHSDVGISAALKSERYLYNNIPNYYLPEYDLIYGGGRDQKTSYKQALINAHGKNYKTYLFPNGM